jgi:hypothetical protein
LDEYRQEIEIKPLAHRCELAGKTNASRSGGRIATGNTENTEMGRRK